MSSTPDISVIILTQDERFSLPIALESLRGLDARVFVVDSGSKDGTPELARSLGCEVAFHPWTSYADQFTWALQNLPFSTKWVMRLDADERLSPELVQELRQELSGARLAVTGYLVKRRVYFWGKWIRHGGYYPTWLLRVWQQGKGRIESRWMDEHIELLEGYPVRLRHDLIDENHKGLTFWVDKHNKYADREVKDMLAIGAERVAIPLDDQAGRRRWLKHNVYSRSPLFLRAFGYWFFRYFVRLGFLDGMAGLIFHFMQGLWYRLLVDAKIYEVRRHSQARDASTGPSNLTKSRSVRE